MSRTSMIRALAIAWLGTLFLLASGCDKGSGTSGSETSSADEKADRGEDGDAKANDDSKSDSPAKPGKAGLDHEIKLKGKTPIELKPKEDGAKLVDESGDKIARLKLSGDKLKIKAPDESVLGYVTGSREHFKVKGPDGEKVLFELKLKDGTYKLKDGSKNELYKVKAKDYGWKIVDAGESDVGKVKVKDGKTSVRNASDETLFSTKDALSPEAAACLAFEKMDLPLRVGLMLRVELAR